MVRTLKKDREKIESEVYSTETLPAQRLTTAEEILWDAAVKVSSLYNQIVTSIRHEDIGHLSVSEKIKAIALLSKIHDTVKGNKQSGKQVFKQINIYKSTTADLEKALLEVSSNE